MAGRPLASQKKDRMKEGIAGTSPDDQKYQILSSRKTFADSESDRECSAAGSVGEG
jgi:hypothetical protein